MSSNFYRAFEDKLRGSRESIRTRLLFYQPLLEGLLSHVDTRQTIDLGCGRGEWLQWLQELGLDARGVDLDAGMLQACQALGLPVQAQDALAALKALPSSSVALVSAFHLVEHMPFDQVHEVIKESHRVLVPGGLLLMETPNSENLGVGTWNFYLDPTHQRPIPHLLLEFVTQFGGFAFTRILRVNEEASLANKEELGLLDVLCRASPDYAVVAMKARQDNKTVDDVFDGFLNQPHGISLETLANRYDDKYSGSIRALEAELFALRAEVTSFRQAEEKLLQQFASDENRESGVTLEKFARAQQAITGRLDRLEEALESQARHFQEMQRRTETALTQQMQSVYASTSWRLTKPVRLLGRVARRIKQALKGNG